MYTSEQLHHALKSHFGFSTFRHHQLPVITTILDQRDALVIMPTGGGKSICYQLPAVMKDGFALVISPLISLMNDQVRAMRSNGISAAALHSGTAPEEMLAIHSDITNGKLKLLYISPERALTPKFQEFLSNKNINLIAIDEAHCVSVWGNDFRPEYSQLTSLTHKFPNAPVLALTATADKATQLDIQHQLQLREPEVFVSSFERPNIYLSVRPGVQRIEQIRDFIREHTDQPGIIYCLARRTTESISTQLNRYGIKAAAYHAELPNPERKQIQDDFQFDKIQVVCATIAFGMGIDKPNIRWVIHYNLPKNIENYYQEIGRSGRDGAPAEALMFYSFRDMSVYQDFIAQSDANEVFKKIQREKLERIWEYSQATNCRTNVILNYFGEYRSEPCGHCDHCAHPPEGFDGSVLTQMALSAVKRTGESVGLNMLVDILRGSGRHEIFERGFNHIKTYGAGRHMSAREWFHYVTQMINQGFLEIDYTRHSILKCTPLSEEVLFQGLLVILQKPVEKSAEPVLKKKSKSQRVTEELLERLSRLNHQLSVEEGIPEFAVFPKGTLKEMAAKRPVTVEAFSALSGMGTFKGNKYGEVFLEAIRDYLANQEILRKPKGGTYIETLGLFRQGMTLHQIAQARSISVSTVAAHLARLYEKGEDINLKSFVRPSDMVLARQAWRASGFSEELSKIKTEVGDSLDYATLHLAMAILRREQKETTS